jgi:drug/metabolite transporter (DMT)-like permease
MKWLLLSVVVVTTVIGDLLQSSEMKSAANRPGGVRGVLPLLRVIAARKYLILAIVSMAVSFFAFLALIQIAPLSFAVPASAATFVLETVLAGLVLKERIGRRRAAGALLVLGGIVLLAH